MASIHFYIQSKENPAVIYVRMRDGRRVDAKAKTKLVVDSEDWSPKKGTPKHTRSEELRRLSKSLADLRSMILGHYNDSEGKVAINSDWLRDLLHKETVEAQETPTGLLEYFDLYARDQEGVISDELYEKIAPNRARIERFERYMGRKYQIKDVDMAFHKDYHRYLIQSEKYSLGTVNRSIKFIKTVCYHAQQNGVEVSYQLKAIRVKNKELPPIYLTEKEIKKIESVKLPHDYLRNARNSLIISCYTAQRVSDLKRNSVKNIRYVDDVPYLDFIQEKTETPVSLPLHPAVMKIIEENGGKFPRAISNDKYNDYIKKVCQLAGIDDEVVGSKAEVFKVKRGDRMVSVTRKRHGKFAKWELVSSHIGRRSFASNHFGKIPTPIIMAATGHRSESSFLKYIGKSRAEMASMLAGYWYGK
jgi:integrase